ncbi:MAG: hypothetical protein ACOX68_01500 [Candidatus Limivicinus sp.]|jgi:multisubunit Na+/H+ antiporter MnhB subunit
MNRVYENSFMQGQALVKKLVIGVVVCCVLSFLSLGGAGGAVQGLLIGATVVLFIMTIYALVKYCRCPYCGKHIYLGVLVAKSCPHCNRNLATGKKMKKK